MKKDPIAISKIGLTTIAVLMITCEGEPDKKLIAEENKALHQRYINEMNKGNEGYLDEYFSANYVYHGPVGELDVEGFKAMHSMFLSAFPDAKISAQDIIAKGDKVVTRWKIRGTHKGEFQGIAPTGKDVTMTGIIITRFEGGKAIEEWEAFDLLTLMQQLGAIPPPGQ